MHRVPWGCASYLGCPGRRPRRPRGPGRGRVRRTAWWCRFVCTTAVPGSPWSSLMPSLRYGAGMRARLALDGAAPEAPCHGGGLRVQLLSVRALPRGVEPARAAGSALGAPLQGGSRTVVQRRKTQGSRIGQAGSGTGFRRHPPGAGACALDKGLRDGQGC